MKPKNCLIFGASGQIGRNLIRSLTKILKREKRFHLFEDCLKFINTRVNLDLASFSDDIWSH